MLAARTGTDDRQPVVKLPRKHVSPRAGFRNTHCIDQDVCTFDRCIDNACSHEAALHGDVTAGSGSCGPNGQITLSDIIAVLNAYNGTAAEGCSLGKYDLGYYDQSEMFVCMPDGVIDMDDIVAVLDSYAGQSPCGCTEEMMGMGTGPDVATGSVGSATLALVSRDESVESANVIEVDVLARDVTDLRSYQIGMTVVTDSSEPISVASIRVDAERSDYVFAGLEGGKGRKRCQEDFLDSAVGHARCVVRCRAV